MACNFWRCTNDANLHNASSAHRQQVASLVSESTDRLQRMQAQLNHVTQERDAALARGKAVAIGFQRLLQSNMASVQAAAHELIASEVPDAVQEQDGSQLSPLEPAPRPPPPQPHSDASADERTTRAASEASDDSGTGIGSGILRGRASLHTSPPPASVPARQASVLLSPTRPSEHSAGSARSAYSEEELGHAHAASTLPRGMGVAPPAGVTHTRPGLQSISSKASSADVDPRAWYHRDPRDLAEAIAASDELVSQHKAAAAAQQRAAAKAAQNPRQGHLTTGTDLHGWSPAREEQKRGGDGSARSGATGAGFDSQLQLDPALLEAAQAAAQPTHTSAARKSTTSSAARSTRPKQGPARPRMVEARPASGPERSGPAAADSFRGGSSTARKTVAAVKHHQRALAGREGHKQVSTAEFAPRFSPNRVTQRGVSGRPPAPDQAGPFGGKPPAEAQGPPSLALHSAVTEATRVAKKMTYEVSRHAGVHHHDLLGRPHTALQAPPQPPRVNKAAMVPRCAYASTARHAAVAQSEAQQGGGAAAARTAAGGGL